MSSALWTLSTSASHSAYSTAVRSSQAPTRACLPPGRRPRNLPGHPPHASSPRPGRFRGVLRKTTLLCLGVLALAPATSHATVTMADVTIPASDGVSLVGDVHLPGDGTGRYPAVVDMEPYGRSSLDRRTSRTATRASTPTCAAAARAAARCACSAQREQQDVYDVVEWVAKQPWSNGQVALYGYSYSAITALLGAALQPPHLDARRRRPPADRPLPRRRLAQRPLRPGLRRPVVRRPDRRAGRSASAPQPQYLDRAQQQFAVETRLIPSTARSTRSARCWRR